ncbi:hypothetical protein COLO4_19132 [Corchorus olitorius]|uniref:DUF4283 domain-containing protein n=1 Tax=Corchorus olitorius TaxID=93759 RepID=A0A1R3J6P5_9ROSI|nr:hypothetical protein COLO4_19132 [Corchorus olitorius]
MKQVELIFVPVPGVGHLASTVEFAKRLIDRDDRIRITVLSMKWDSSAFVDSYTQSLAASPPDRIQLIQLPQVDPPPFDLLFKSAESFIYATVKSYIPPVRNAVRDIVSQKSSSNSTRIAGDCNRIDSSSVSFDSDDSINSQWQGTKRHPSPWLRRRRGAMEEIGTGDLKEGREEGTACLVAFLLDARRFSTNAVQKAMERRWNFRGPINVIGRDDHRYLVHFELEIDRNLVLQQNPWFFQGALFVFERWDSNRILSEARVESMEIWIQIWNLPFEYQRPTIATKLARHAGEVLEVDWEYKKHRNIQFIRVKCRIEPWKPLVAGCMMKRDDGIVQWAEFSSLIISEVEKRVAEQPDASFWKDSLSPIQEQDDGGFDNSQSSRQKRKRLTDPDDEHETSGGRRRRRRMQQPEMNKEGKSNIVSGNSDAVEGLRQAGPIQPPQES